MKVTKKPLYLRFTVVFHILGLLLMLCGCTCADVQSVPDRTALPDKTLVQSPIPELPDTTPTIPPLPNEEPPHTVTEQNAAEILYRIAEALPDGWSCGEYDIMLGDHGGGIPVYDTTLSPVGIIEHNRAFSPIFNCGDFVEVRNTDNHAGFSSPFTALDSSTSCIYAGYSMDIYDYNQCRYMKTEESWYIFWAKEDCQPMYAAKLLKSSIDQVEVALFATRVEIHESAFSQG